MMWALLRITMEVVQVHLEMSIIIVSIAQVAESHSSNVSNSIDRSIKPKINQSIIVIVLEVRIAISMLTSTQTVGWSQGRIQTVGQGGELMASTEREPIMGVWGFAPSGVQGQSPWLRPLELTSFRQMRHLFSHKICIKLGQNSYCTRLNTKHKSLRRRGLIK